MTFCYTSAGIGGSFRTHGQTHGGGGGGGGRTDRRGSRNSYLDIYVEMSSSEAKKDRRTYFSKHNGSVHLFKLSG